MSKVGSRLEDWDAFARDVKNPASRLLARRVFPAFFAVACLIGLLAHSLAAVAIISILISAVMYARLGASSTPGNR
jgi:fatty acid desaturase